MRTTNEPSAPEAGNAPAAANAPTGGDARPANVAGDGHGPPAPAAGNVPATGNAPAGGDARPANVAGDGREPPAPAAGNVPAAGNIPDAYNLPAPGRIPNAFYLFPPEHALSTQRCMALRSKFKCPILAGGPPPKYPGLARQDGNAVWQARADRFALYMLTLLVPWCIETGVPSCLVDPATLLPYPDKTSWEIFCDWARDARSPDASFVQKARLQYCENVGTGLSVSSKKKMAMAAWRARAVVPWNQMLPQVSHANPASITFKRFNLHACM